MTLARNQSPAAARYPGRACLLGEHCDWAGGSSLTVPLPMGITVEGEDGVERDRIVLETVLDGVPLQASWHRSGRVDRDGGQLRFVPAALAALATRDIHPPPTVLRVTSDLPAGRGFSSSAAFTLAVVDTLAQRSGQPLDPLDAAHLAYEVEHDLLGVECGRLDQIACASRAPVFVRWADGSYEVRPTQLGTDFHLIVIALPRPRDTQVILSTLQRDFESSANSAAASAIRVFAAAAEAGVRALEAGAPARLGQAMNDAQQAYAQHLDSRLNELHAPVLTKACAHLIGQGALGAKFSGAGGEGSVVALFATKEGALNGLNSVQAGQLGQGYYVPVAP